MLHLKKLLGPEGMALPCQLDEHSLRLWLPSSGQYIPAVKTERKPQDILLGKNRYHAQSGWLAVDRVIAAILENGQQEDGTVRLPEVMVPYLHTDRLA